jgi:ligand-binding sensor domain-containing protein
VWKTKALLHGVEILSALLVWISVGCLHAEQVDRTIGQLVHTSWSVKDGVPGDVYALAQTTDGLLWLGTMQGLCRRSSVRCLDAEGLPFPRACMLVCCRA